MLCSLWERSCGGAEDTTVTLLGAGRGAIVEGFTEEVTFELGLEGRVGVTPEKHRKDIPGRSGQNPGLAWSGKGGASRVAAGGVGASGQ